MDNLPRVSVVTPSFNQAAFLPRTIESVLGQDYPNLEYIVIDGGSTDGSTSIIERYAGRLTYWESRPDNGPAQAINRGFARSTGTILAYLNSDDVYRPGALRKAVMRLIEADAAIVYGDIAFVDHADAPTVFPGGRALIYRAAPFMRGALFHDAMFIPQQASFWRRKVYEDVGPMVEENKTTWDHEFFVHAALRGFRFARISAVLGDFRIHKNSISSENRWDEHRRADRCRIEAAIIGSGYRKAAWKRTAYSALVRGVRLARYLCPAI